jgi:hypothetical protein
VCMAQRACGVWVTHMHTPELCRHVHIVVVETWHTFPPSSTPTEPCIPFPATSRDVGQEDLSGAVHRQRKRTHGPPQPDDGQRKQNRHPPNACFGECN